MPRRRRPAPLVRGGVTTPLEREAAPFWPRGIVCGAHNFAPGDLVVVALPGSERCPGGFGIASRKTYGHVSDGMICAEDELGLGSDHSGIIVLPRGRRRG
jgi:phenylalanyl-tRNA synthetase beta chain